ncbi:MAG: hypothetical protein ABI615_01785 [Chthoniobacterales bacterium]
MSNWTIITADDLKATGLGFVIDKAQTAATGGTDPIAEEIEGAVARVRRAITGSALDADPAKVPNSLKPVARRMALFALMERIRLPLSDDHKKSRDADNSDLLRISDKRIPVETPDVSGGNAEMSPLGGVVAVNVPSRLTGRDRTSGL